MTATWLATTAALPTCHTPNSALLVWFIWSLERER